MSSLFRTFFQAFRCNYIPLFTGLVRDFQAFKCNYFPLFTGLVRDFPALITIPELNFTVTPQHFDYSESLDNNITYNIYYSKYLSVDDDFTLQFG